MNKLAVVFWSGTGNTETMANLIAEGCNAAGGAATLIPFAEAGADILSAYDAFAFGCPSMGAEQLEDGDVEPNFSALESGLNGKKVALFGSYGWGDGQWMRDWCERTTGAGATLAQEEGLIANETPDDDAEEACRALGATLASW
ncbi:MAG: flavodoxin [Faecalibacterium sp.]